MAQKSPKTGIGLTFILGMLILFTASFGFALAKKNNAIKKEKSTLADKVIQLEEKVRVLAHSKEELELVRNSLSAEIAQLRRDVEQKSTETNIKSEQDLEEKEAEIVSDDG